MNIQTDFVKRAWKAGLVIPSFNIGYLPMMEPVIQAIADQRSFAQVSTAHVEWQLLDSKGLDEVMQEFKKWGQPKYVTLHLDHVPSIDEGTKEPLDYYKIIENAIKLGYPSVMVDGSHEKTLDQNIKVTRQIVDLAHKNGVLVEAEVGQLFGYAAEEIPDYEEIFQKKLGFTTDQDVSRIVQETKCDWLSVAVGSFHGAIVAVGAGLPEQKPQARLDIELIERLNTIADRPLVLHGGSGILKEDMNAAVKKGIAKVNVGQHIRKPYQDTLRKKTSTTAAQQAVYDSTTKLIKEYFNIAGSSKVINPK